jgi:hypothetical protein
VFTLQGEVQLVMVELAPVGIDPIVTGQASWSESFYMRLGVSRIQLAVTIGAGGHVKARQILAVAIGASKLATRCRLPVALQRIPCSRMGKSINIHIGQPGICPPVLGMAVVAQ